MDSMVGSAMSQVATSRRSPELASVSKPVRGPEFAKNKPTELGVRAPEAASPKGLTARAFRPAAQSDYRALGRAWAAKSSVPTMDSVRPPAAATPSLGAVRTPSIPEAPKPGSASGAKARAAAPEAALPKKNAGPSLREMKAPAPIDTRVVAGDPGATVGKLRPLHQTLRASVGKLSMGQGRALMDTGTKTAAAHAASVHRQMNTTKRSQDIGRRRYAAQVKNQQRQAVKAAEKLKVKFDSIPEHLREFAEKAGKEVTVPGAAEESTAARLLSDKGVVEFTGPGRRAYDKFMAAQ